MHYINKNANLYGRRGVDPEAYWMRTQQQGPGENGNTGTAPTGPTAPPEPVTSPTPTAPTEPTPPVPAEINFPGLFNPNVNTIISTIENCLGVTILIRLKNGESFWMVPEIKNSETVSGRIWNESSGWYAGEVNFFDISNVTCTSGNGS